MFVPIARISPTLSSMNFAVHYRLFTLTTSVIAVDQWNSNTAAPSGKGTVLMFFSFAIYFSSFFLSTLLYDVDEESVCPSSRILPLFFRPRTPSSTGSAVCSCLAQQQERVFVYRYNCFLPFSLVLAPSFFFFLDFSFFVFFFPLLLLSCLRPWTVSTSKICKR